MEDVDYIILLIIVIVALGSFWAGYLVGKAVHRNHVASQFENAEFVALPTRALAARCCVTCFAPFNERVTRRQIAVAQCERCLKEGRTIKPFKSEVDDGTTEE